MPETLKVPFQYRVRKILKKSQRSLDHAGRYVQFNHFLFLAVFCLSAISFWIAYEFRFDFRVPPSFNAERLLLLPYVAAFKVILFYILRGHRSNWRYIGLNDLPLLVAHCFLGSMALLLLPFISSTLVVPKGVVLIDFFLSMVLIGGARISIRIFREWMRAYISRTGTAGEQQTVVIGAGDAGEMLVREVTRNPRSGFRIRALFDDDINKVGLSIHGIKVMGRVDDLPMYVENNPIDMIIVAIPSANKKQMKRIHTLVKDLGPSVKTLPSLHEIIAGSSRLMQLRDIDITDLLGREEIRIDSEQIHTLICDKVIVVTGAGGSIGSELCRQILRRNPARLVLIERAENNLFHIDRELLELVENGRDVIVPVLCDVTDEARISSEFERFRPDLVFHAAAYKHVPMQELNPLECFKNNICGTRTVVQAADRFGVSLFLLISTDKAVNPISVMGASKRACERYCQAYGRISRTRILSVRFGNVLASEGSVVPVFMDQIARGGPVTITHPEMKRYFMTIPEAVTLVLQATAIGESGEILILEMGEPVRILDMAHQLMHLVGKSPEDVPVEFIGIRPGEKLTEEICFTEEICRTTSHEKIKVFNRNEDSPQDIIHKIDRAIALVAKTSDPPRIRGILKEIVPEYDPPQSSQSSAKMKSEASRG